LHSLSCVSSFVRRDSVKRLTLAAFSRLFILTLIIPAAFALIWLLLTLYVVLFILREVKPALVFLASAVFGIVVGAVLLFVAGRPICEVRASSRI